MPQREEEDKCRLATKLLADSFCSGAPIRQALDATQQRHGTAAWDTPAAQQSLLEKTLQYGDRIVGEIPDFTFGVARCARFTRLLLDEIDHCGAAIDESFIVRAASLCTQSRTRDDIRWLVLRIPYLDACGDHDHNSEDECECEPVIVRVADAFSELGLQVWEAGIAMCILLTQSGSTLHSDVNGKRVLELGAGTGVSARALQTAGVARAWLTDLPHTMENLRRNIAVNTSTDLISAHELNVADLQHLVQTANSWHVDTVLAADVTYDDVLIVSVVAAFHALLHADEHRVGYLFFTSRSERTDALLRSQLSARRLVVDELEMTMPHGMLDYMVQCHYNAVGAVRIRAQE